MKLLENRILRDARVLSDDVLNVGSFLAEQTDVAFVAELADEFCRRFENDRPTKVLAAGSSGTVAAVLTANKLSIPLITAQKSGGLSFSSDNYVGKVVSFTNSEVYDLTVSRRFLSRNDRILIISDFLSKGNEVLGLADIVELSGAVLCGVGILIEKSYLNGAKSLRDKGVRVESLARIESMSPSNGIRFIEE